MLGTENEPPGMENVLEKPLYRSDHLFQMYLIFRKSLGQRRIDLDEVLTSLKGRIDTYFAEIEPERDRLTKSAIRTLNSFDLEGMITSRVNEVKKVIKNDKRWEPTHKQYQSSELTAVNKVEEKLDAFICDKLRSELSKPRIVFIIDSQLKQQEFEKVYNDLHLQEVLEQEKEKLKGGLKEKINEEVAYGACQKARQEIDSFIEEHLGGVIMNANEGNIPAYSDNTKRVAKKKGTFFATSWTYMAADGFGKRQVRDFNEKHSGINAAQDSRYLLGEKVDGDSLPSFTAKYKSEEIGKPMDFRWEGAFPITDNDFDIRKVMDPKDMNNLVKRFLAYQSTLREVDQRLHGIKKPLYKGDENPGIVGRFLNTLFGYKPRKLVGYEVVELK